MRKTVVVTPSASKEAIRNYYLDEEIVGIDKGILIARQSGARISLALSSFKDVPLETLLSFIPKENIMKYEDSGKKENRKKIITYLLTHRSGDIVILQSFDEAFDDNYALFSLLKEGKGRIGIQDQHNLINYYGEGVHILNRLGQSGFSLYGFPEAVISLEHVNKPLKNIRLSFFNGNMYQSSILERIAVLRVQKGGVLLVRNTAL